jgi:hypothetical protein
MTPIKSWRDRPTPIVVVPPQAILKWMRHVNGFRIETTALGLVVEHGGAAIIVPWQHVRDPLTQALATGSPM